ncbi:MAG: hypothetical protein KY462_08155 [Actinobacteria bacterium]|nr:hypothetical protein [Actinomycetota bacterium]
MTATRPTQPTTVEAAPQAGRLDELRARLAVGAPAGPLAGLPDRVVRAVTLAAAVGAPAVPALDAALAAEDDRRRLERSVTVATAQARTVAAGLALLPPLAIAGTGHLLGEPLWRFYLTGAGRIVGLVGATLAAIGVVTVRALARHASGAWRQDPAPPDEAADLTATALTGGLAPTAALRAAAGLLPARSAGLRQLALAVELGLPARPDTDLEPIARALTAATGWGAPAGPALRRAAADLRAEELTRALARAERLPALLAFPTALCLLPSCLLLVGAPLIGAGLAAAAGT